MLRKVIDEFDIDTYGWFTDNANNPTISTLTKPAEEIWSLWVKQRTKFDFVDSSLMPNQSVMSVAADLMQVLNSSRYAKPQPPDEDTVIGEFFAAIDKGHRAYADYSHLHTILQNPTTCDNFRSVSIPNFLLSSKTLETVGDSYLLSDAITGTGLESFEASTTSLTPLKKKGLRHLLDLNTLTPKRHPNDSTHRDREAVIAQCTLDIWWSLQIRTIRNKILASWPGWSDIFLAQDQVMMPCSESMQSHISKKSPHRSELRRFCMALAWNINPHNERVSFPKSMSSAYDWAIGQWPSIESTPDLNGDKLDAIHQFVMNLAANLDCTESIPERSTPLTGSNNHNLTGTPPKFKSNYSPSRSNAHTIVEPRKLTNEPGTGKDANNPVPAVFTPPLDWSRIDSPALRNQARKSKEFQDKCRRLISDEISASAWFVPNPPPLEHGNLNGTLDEGNLLRFAAFSDPNIFSISPESGYGQIVLGILVDASASMESAPDGLLGVSSMQAACCFVGGVKDGLARNPNVKVEAYAFDSRSLSPDLVLDHHSAKTDEHKALIETKHNTLTHDQVCVMRPLNTDDDLTHTQHFGGTPTAMALHALDNHLASFYPEAQRIILILTDGGPCGYVVHPHWSDLSPNQPARHVPSFSDSIEETRKMVSSISTPIFCVGLGVDGDTLKQQYNVGHWFTVSSPLEAVKVAADLIRKIGASFNC